MPGAASDGEDDDEHESPADFVQTTVDVGAEVSGETRAARRTQKIIHVTKPASRIERTPPVASGAVQLSPQAPKGRIAPSASVDGDGDAVPGPDTLEHVTTVDLDQVGDQDADDESGFEAFMQADRDVASTGSFRTMLKRLHISRVGAS